MKKVRENRQIASLKFIRHKLYLPILSLLGAFIVVALVLQQFTWLLSALLGASCSWLILTNQMKSQVKILATKQRGAFFSAYIFRLCLYAVPILMSLKVAIFDLWVTLAFLFIFQGCFVFFMIIRSYRKHRRRFC